MWSVATRKSQSSGAVVGEGNGGLGTVAKDVEDIAKQRRVEVGSPEGAVSGRLLHDRAGVADDRGIKAEQFGHRPHRRYRRPVHSTGRMPAAAARTTASAVLGRNRPCAFKQCAVDVEREQAITPLRSRFAEFLIQPIASPCTVSARRSYQGRPSPGKPRRTEDCQAQNPVRVRRSKVDKEKMPAFRVRILGYLFRLGSSFMVIVSAWDFAMPLNRAVGRMTTPRYSAKMGEILS